MEWHWQLPLARFGEYWLQARNLLDRGLRPGAVTTYRPMQQARARVLLTRLLATPNQLKAHVELYEIIVLHDDMILIYLSHLFSVSKASLFWI
jgi:cytochrome P450